MEQRQTKKTQFEIYCRNGDTANQKLVEHLANISVKIKKTKHLYIYKQYNVNVKMTFSLKKNFKKLKAVPQKDQIKELFTKKT